MIARPRKSALGLALLGLCACPVSGEHKDRARLEQPRGGVASQAQDLAAPGRVATHGVSIGELSSQGLVVWSRTDRDARMHVRLEAQGAAPVNGSALVGAERDFTGSVALGGLEPATRYDYAVWFTDPDVAAPAGPAPENASRGVVRTAPEATRRAAVRFAWGGDLAGQDVCRDRARGFAIMDQLGAEALDFFIALGDMIYADNPCTARGLYGNAQVPGLDIATDLAGFWAHWRYARDDAAWRDFLARVPSYAVWDDHEVVNDAGPEHDTRSEPPYTAGQRLMPLGLRAFLDYNPWPRAPERAGAKDDAPVRLYRSVRWGRHLELFLLDTRQYRASNRAPDTGDSPKSMLGAEQRAWLERGLTTSDATWKVVISSVPMAIPTGFPAENGRDGWANHDQDTGFERELLGILESAHRAGVRDTVWLTTDVHFATAFRYTPFADDPAFHAHEWVSGPLNAGLYPNQAFDTTLHPERLFFFGPKPGQSLTYEQAVGFMNYGRASIDERGALTLAIVDGRGATVYSQTFEPPGSL